MQRHLLTISIGPVQDFISAARRSRDLWFGSYLLSEISRATAQAVQSEISRATAQALQEDKGGLIFPAPEALDKSNGQELNIANVILAELPEGSVPDDVVKAAEDAANACWKKFANHAHKAAKELIDPGRWNEQLDDVLEFYAAWTPLESPTEYKETRQRLMRLLAGRKACRDFQPAKGHQGIPKSSLDGARESVLIDAKERRQRLEEELAQRFRFARGEELDVVGATKRAATKETFASVVRVAADPWIRGIQQDGGQAVALLHKIAKSCENASFATGTGKRRGKPTKKCYPDFPYDGAVLYPSRLNNMLHPSQNRQNSYAYEDMLKEDDLKTLRQIKNWLEKLQKAPSEGLGYGEPEPYLAILMADGDHMGKVLSNIPKMEQHQQFSQQLAEFAGQAREIVEEQHNGCLIYSGGDDVLALLPVDCCLSCARALHDKFGELLSEWQDDENKPTLSVGLAIGHCLEPLEDLRNYAKDAEKAAKNPKRDGLAVRLHPRSGPPIQVRSQWKANLDKRLQRWAEMHLKEEISDKAAYDLRQLARDYAGWPDSKETTDQAIKKDIKRLLGRKQKTQYTLEPTLEDDLTACFHSTGSDPTKLHRDHHPGVMQLANEWLIARRLAKAMRQAQGLQGTTGHKESAA